MIIKGLFNMALKSVNVVTNRFKFALLAHGNINSDCRVYIVLCLLNKNKAILKKRLDYPIIYIESLTLSCL